MKYLLLIATALLLSGCFKDKLENESLLLEGIWTWDHSIEYTYDDVNQVVVTTRLEAADYPGSYQLQFQKKGKVSAHRDGFDLEQFRIVLPKFTSDVSRLKGGYAYKIKLDDSETDTLVGYVNSDTLITSDFHLPLTKGTNEYPHYDHYFLK